MAKKTQKAPPTKDRVAADYYKLNTQAIDDLVTANEENSPPVSEKELDKYRSGPKLDMANWLKIILIKTWFAGAVCFFFLWGLGIYLQNQLDQIVLVAVAYGMVTDLLTNNVFRFLSKRPGSNDHWMMVTKGGVVSLVLNLLYGGVVILCVVVTYDLINRLLLLFMPDNPMPFGVEPITFGILTTAWDSLFILMKHTLKRMFTEARRTVDAEKEKKQP